MTAALLIVGAFLLGSVPFGLVIARMKGVDIRRHGSGNIGATNVGRALGRKWFYVVFVLDFAKGCIPVLAAGWLLGTLGRLAIEPMDSARWLGVGIAAVLGHVFSPWLKFKGGKGVATGAGVIVGLFPAMTVPALGAFIAFALAMRVWRYMSVASMCAACSLPLCVAAWFHAAHLGFGPDEADRVEVRHMLAFLAFGAMLSVLVVWTHRGNIARLRAGTEPKFGAAKRPPEG